MYYNKDKFEHTPDMRDPVTGDWLPLSESDKARIIRQEESMKEAQMKASINANGILQLLTSIMK